MSAVIQTGEDGIRPMTLQDLDGVMAIENQIYPYPWTRGIFSDCIRVGYQCHVYQQNNEIVSYCVLSIGAGEAHVLTVCVREDYQCQGVGHMMMSHMVKLAQITGAESILLEVRPSNEKAIRLYQRLGFIEVGVRPDYYPADDEREDALIMARQLRFELAKE